MAGLIRRIAMEIIIIGTLLLGTLFCVYALFKNRRKRRYSRFRPFGTHDRPRVIQLPKDLEKEKRRRHIH